MSLAAFLLAYGGFAALALAMDRHYEAVFDSAISARRRLMLRWLGSIGLAASLWASVAVYGWSYGLTEWIGILAIAGLLLIWILTYRPAVALMLAGVAVLLTPVAALT